MCSLLTRVGAARAIPPSAEPHSPTTDSSFEGLAATLMTMLPDPNRLHGNVFTLDGHDRPPRHRLPSRTLPQPERPGRSIGSCSQLGDDLLPLTVVLVL